MTRDEFLNEYRSTHKDWAGSAGSEHIKEPSPERIDQGWVIEQPQHTFFNWHMNRTDRRLRNLEARVAWLEKCLGQNR